MRFARKQSPNALAGLKYPNDRNQIRNILRAEQKGFCAYTEIFLDEVTYTPEIEHFYPASDSLYAHLISDYNNLYLTTPKINRAKSDILPPAVALYPKDIWDKLLCSTKYFFVYPNPNLLPTAAEQLAVSALINYLDLNNEGLTKKRREHVRMVAEFCKKKRKQEIVEAIKAYPQTCLHFPSFLETYFKIDLGL